MFRVGQKVVCVDAEDPYPYTFDGDALVEGRVYTVAGFDKPFGVSSVLLLEAKNNITRDFVTRKNCGYRATRFRPVVARKTDISALTALLNPTHKIMGSVE